ncbi:MAG: hypothetical protein ACOC6J_01925 [Spirochaetota bacterium]
MRRTIFRFVLALVSLAALLGACATVPDGRQPAAPVVSWPGSPAETAAISWHAPNREAAIELVGPDGPIHLFTTGSAGSRIDALYPRFFTHRPFREERTFTSLDDGGEVTRVFVQRPWQRERAKTEGAGVRYQDPAVYPNAASYFSFPFDDADGVRGEHGTVITTPTGTPMRFELGE